MCHNNGKSFPKTNRIISFVYIYIDLEMNIHFVAFRSLGGNKEKNDTNPADNSDLPFRNK